MQDFYFEYLLCCCPGKKKKKDLPPRAVWELGIGEEVGGREGR